MNTRKRTLLGFTLATLCIFLMGLSSLLSSLNLRESTVLTQHTLEVKNELDSLSSLFISTQNNLRGYHLSGDEYHLRGFEQSRKNITKTLDHVESLVQDNETQFKIFNELRPQLLERMRLWEEYLKDKNKRLDDIKNAMRSEEIKVKNNLILDAISALKSNQDEILLSHIKKTQDYGLLTQRYVIIGGVFALIIVIVAGHIVNRDMRRREEAEAEMDRFFNVSLDMLCISGMDGYFKKISPAFEDVLGFTREELYSKPITEFIHPQDIEKTVQEIERQSHGHKVLSFENRFRHKNGNYRLFSWKSVPVGERMYAVARDVTAQKEFEKQLVEAQASSQQAARAKSEFLANMSHEIRTPLNGIIGVTDLLSKTDLESEQSRFVDIIRDSGSNLLKIINEILDFSKIEAGKMEAEILDFELNHLVEGQKSIIGKSLQDKNLTIKTSIDPQIPRYLKGDSGRIGQVLLNLLNNAIKFTPQGSVLLKVELLSKEGNFCKIKFNLTDSGIGMTQEESRKLFMPFVQADGSTARKYGGTGLGLSICKRLVEMMNGTIGVDSQIGAGSNFWFILDLEVSDYRPKEIQVPVRPQLTLHNFKVLVAEDNSVNQLIVRKMLEKFHCNVHLVANGLEAVEAFSRDQYDLILMDHHMPEMDGIEATKRIRQMERDQNLTKTTILAFTANVLEEDQKLCRSVGMDDFIHKPVTLEALEKALQKWGGANEFR